MKSSTKEVMLTVRICVRLLSKLNSVSRKKNTTRSELIRDIFEKSLDNR